MLTFLRGKGTFNNSDGSPAKESQKFGPKDDDSPSIGGTCIACGEDFESGDFTTLIPLGPGSDEDRRKKAREGKYYSVVSVEIHWECATGQAIHKAESPR